MAGLLGDIYSYGDTLKRKVKGLLADPVGTVSQMAGQFNDDMNAQIGNMRSGYGFDGGKSVLASPEQQAGARQSLADYGANMGIAGMFVGKGAKTWDAISAKKAEEMAAKGVDPRKVWSETGTWKGPDGMWRQEIPDNAASLKSGNISAEQMRQVNGGDWIKENDFLAKHYNTPEAAAIRTRASMRNGGILNDDTPKLFETLNHGLLNDSYPELNKIRVALDDKMPIGNAAYAEGNNAIVMSPMHDKDALSSKLHEVQHAIQQREGFARGGAPGANGLTWDELTGEGRKLYESSRNAYDDPILKDLFEGSTPLKPWEEMTPITRTPYIEQAQEGAYRRLAGEAEARATEKRLPLNAAQRRALFPEDSYDVPMNQLIIRGLLADK